MNASALLAALISLSGATEPSASPFWKLPSAREWPEDWAAVTEVEHKDDFAVIRARVCVRASDLTELFPIADGSGLYWDYVHRFQRDRRVEQVELGTVGEVRITETVVRFSEPIDYIKIVSFTPPDTRLLCPFIVIAEWNHQTEYARSEIVQTDTGAQIQTLMVDHLATSVRFSFRLREGLPELVERVGWGD